MTTEATATVQRPAKAPRRKYRFKSRDIAELHVDIAQERANMLDLAVNDLCAGRAKTICHGAYIGRVIGADRSSGGCVALTFHCPGQRPSTTVYNARQMTEMHATLSRHVPTDEEARAFRSLVSQCLTALQRGKS